MLCHPSQRARSRDFDKPLVLGPRTSGLKCVVHCTSAAFTFLQKLCPVMVWSSGNVMILHDESHLVYPRRKIYIMGRIPFSRRLLFCRRVTTSMKRPTLSSASTTELLIESCRWYGLEAGKSNLHSLALIAPLAPITMGFCWVVGLQLRLPISATP
ncbi:hypothetical protein EDB81DRAFT_25186 [Dactylonectria macrodidyma]|uniref:Uncharacterized protein n=1 Tax=Dactylonectria macrodidyma TaxID=307937 RepID=A0A9P9JQZ5_9HYPO|nr:hypothetical protein EDB81DRAFT_25186 [Dactylonectria macrodidyma]